MANRHRAAFARLLRAGGGRYYAIRVAGAGTYDPTTGTVAAPAAQTVSVLGRIFASRDTGNADGSLTYDRTALLAPVDASGASYTARPDQQITDDAGRVYEFADVAPHQINGISVGYRATLRAGR